VEEELLDLVAASDDVETEALDVLAAAVA